ncbi:MAG: DUF58 domain-containing protein [Ruminococcaceae bacterium]|nr:DUF58 domain-containing protein [Oscillospiraceae bacterium]
MGKNKISENSSVLVSLPALCFWLGFALLSAVAGYTVLAGLFMFFLLFFAFVRYWSERAMDGVSLEISCDNCRIFPGMETVFDYRVKNDKLLPLVWLELSQNAAEKDIVVPDDSFEAYSYFDDDGEKIQELRAYKRGFSLMMGYESMVLSSHWQAKHRGIYRPNRLLLRSGDGFGLSQVEKLYPAELLPELVVYPRRVPVDAELFLRQDWDKSYGSLGFKEDMSVLRGLRPYSHSDSWKRINWRMAARQPSALQVNFFETVQPASALFILDGESYCRDAAALEAVLEIISSLIESLLSRGVNCGLCLPKSRDLAAVNVSSDQQLSASELLYYLAAYDCLKDEIKDMDGRGTGEYKPSAFELSGLGRAAAESGTAALFTNSPAELSPRLLEKLERSRLMIFSSAPLGHPDKELSVQHISALRKGGES